VTGTFVIYFLSLILGTTFNSLIISFVLAYFLFPFVKKIEKWGMSRRVIICIVLLFVALFLTFFSIYLVPMLWDQVLVFIQHLPEYGQKLQKIILDLGNRFGLDMAPHLEKILSREGVISFSTNHFEALAGNIFLPFLDFSQKGISGILVFFKFLANLVLIPFFFFFFVNSYEKLTQQFAELIPSHQRQSLKTYLDRFSEILNGYFRGQILLLLFLFFYFSIGLSLIGVPFALLIGFITGVICIIPYVGISLSFLLSMGTVFIYSENLLRDVILVAVLYAFEWLIETPFLYPKLIGKKVGLSMLETILALVAGVNLAGILGGFLAVPVMSIFKYILHDILNFYKKSEFYNSNN
ncbi:MAG: AI-2E family transporter, partial [Bacteriovoracaceae bacterium]|nr:AI-2E family transporter [Bacteriovoracaceae bacterium]